MKRGKSKYLGLAYTSVTKTYRNIKRIRCQKTDILKCIIFHQHKRLNRDAVIVDFIELNNIGDHTVTRSRDRHSRKKVIDYSFHNYVKCSIIRRRPYSILTCKRQN